MVCLDVFMVIGLLGGVMLVYRGGAGCSGACFGCTEAWREPECLYQLILTPIKTAFLPCLFLLETHESPSTHTSITGPYKVREIKGYKKNQGLECFYKQIIIIILIQYQLKVRK